MEFLAGDVWAVLAVWIMDTLSFVTNVELYVTLFVAPVKVADLGTK